MSKEMVRLLTWSCALFGSPAALALCLRPVNFASPPFDGFAFIVEVTVVSPVNIYPKLRFLNPLSQFLPQKHVDSCCSLKNLAIAIRRPLVYLEQHLARLNLPTTIIDSHLDVIDPPLKSLGQTHQLLSL